MKFEKMGANLPGCCRLKFDVGQLNFEQHSEDPLIMQSVSPLANKQEQRLREDLVKNITKSDIILGSWENEELYSAWPEIRRLLDMFPHQKYRKVHLRQFPPLKQLPIHRDGISKDDEKKTQYDLFNSTLRIHIPLRTNADSYMYCSGKFYSMAEGECWMLDNFQEHTAVNFSKTEYRVHLVIDVEPTLETMALVDQSDTDLGIEDAELLQKLR
jgi:hypothetical protein